MNGLYTLMLFLFIFGTVTQGVNEMGLFTVVIPTNGAQMNTSVVTSLQSGALGTDLNPWNTIMILMSFLKVIGAGVIAMFIVLPFIVQILTMGGMAMSQALIVAGMIQAPITFVTLFGLYEWWTGRWVT